MEEPVEEVGPEDGYLLIRIHVPELNVQKCLQFPRDQLVWDVKQQCLAALPKDLKESFNYGLFCPAQNGRAGKFLDEERRLGDYPFNGPVGYLELKYKRRVYKALGLDEKQLRSLHTRANLRRLLDYVANGQVEKIAKMCSKGIDPNFHCPDTGETPLTLATSTKNPGKTLMALVNGGAILDYRTRDGATALHRAVNHNSTEALKTLLELGASPNYRDAKGLTPLYLTISSKIDPALTELLLRDHATTGAADLQGWREAHQACRAGLTSHLEHLVYYGADMNVRNASGNTPLHVCAVNNQESCARLLLFRGCDKEALNYANQTAYQVAVIAGNLDLAEVINQHRPEDVVPFREAPTLRRGRRMTPSMSGSVYGRDGSPTLSLHSNRSMYPYSEASSSLSDASSAAASYLSHMTDKSIGDTSDVVSESSGVGTGSDTNASLPPGSSVVCIEDYRSCIPGHLTLLRGDILEVIGISEDGLLEGQGRQGTGLFPASCVEEVRMRGLELPQNRVEGRRETNTHFATAPRLKKTSASEPRTVVLHRARKGFGFVLRGAKAASPLMELRPSDRCPGLQYLDDVDAGGVADRAGLRKGDYLLAINGEDVSAASHERVVELIRRSGELVQMTVVSLGPPVGTVTSSPSASSVATLPRPATLGRRAPLPPRRDPNTSLSAATAPRTASIRARPVSSRITAAELEELFQRQRGEPAGLMASSTFVAAGSVPGSGPGSPRVYASVAEMKRSKSKGSTKLRIFGSKKKSNMTELHREFHSSPDLASLEAELAAAAKPHRSQEDVGSTLRPLPPSHPPPPPPTSQVVKVETRPTGPRGGILVSRGEVVSARAGPEAEPCEVMSSFRPCDNAKLYAQPDEIKTVGFRARASIRKSHSLRSPPKGCLTGDEDARVPTNGTLPHTGHNSANSNTNPYAQPFRQPVRARGGSLSETGPRAPPIPDPDYSCSESEAEDEVAGKKGGTASQETSGNSNSSGSSGAVPHSFSVQEIQKVRTKLKSSRSFPNEFGNGTKEEDGDNSSSGVSSDQDVPPDDANHTFHRQNSIRISNKQKAMQLVSSLALLPPPLEEEACEGAVVVPPPAEFTEMEVLAPPPPQFSDGRLVTRVRVEHHPPH